MVPRLSTPGVSVATGLPARVIVSVTREIFESLKRMLPLLRAVSLLVSDCRTGAVTRYSLKCCSAAQYSTAVVRAHSALRKSIRSLW